MKNYLKQIAVIAILAIALIGIVASCRAPQTSNDSVDGGGCWKSECETRKGTWVTIEVKGEPVLECIQVFHYRSMSLVGCKEIKK